MLVWLNKNGTEKNWRTHIFRVTQKLFNFMREKKLMNGEFWYFLFGGSCERICYKTIFDTFGKKCCDLWRLFEIFLTFLLWNFHYIKMKFIKVKKGNENWCQASELTELLWFQEKLSSNWSQLTLFVPTYQVCMINNLYFPYSTKNYFHNSPRCHFQVSSSIPFNILNILSL